jgi:hypothetical protein
MMAQDRRPRPGAQTAGAGPGRPAGAADAAASDHKGQTGPQSIRPTLNRGGRRFVTVLIRRSVLAELIGVVQSPIRCG